MSSSGERMSTHARTGLPGAARYFTSWRISLRLAFRDIAKNKGRAALVVLLVGLPVFVIAGAGTFAVTKDVSPKEALSRRMGTGQALLAPANQQTAFLNLPDSWQSMTSDPSMPKLRKLPGASSIGGFSVGEVRTVTGGQLWPTSEAQVRVAVGDRHIDARVLGVDGRQHVYAGMAHLVSGHWPTTSQQVLVSTAGKASGIPAHGTLSVDDGSGSVTQVTVVGTAVTPNAEALVTAPDAAVDWATPTAWILQRSTPVTWPEVKQLNEFDIFVESRDVVDHPGQANEDAFIQGYNVGSGVPASIGVLLGTGLVLVIALLAGPAFAASGKRHRRALGLLASNGATKSQLRRYLLAQALVLGALSAAVSLALGAAAGSAAAEIWQRIDPRMVFGPIDLRWGWGALLFCVAVVASLVAAFVPAVIASRLNLIQVLRGQVSAPRVHPGWPLAGLAVACAGGALMTYALRSGAAVRSTKSELAVAGGAIGLFAGALMTAPWLLLQLGRLAGFLPLATRLAVRDLARQRGRGVATIGAIMATVGVMTTLMIGFASFDAAARRNYQPQLPMGQARLSGVGSDLEAEVQVVRQTLPHATIVGLWSLGPNDSQAASVPQNGAQSTTQWERVSAAYSTGCTDAQAVSFAVGGISVSNCVPTIAIQTGQLISASVEQLTRIYRLTPTESAALRRGEVLTTKLTSGRTWRVVAGSAVFDGNSGEATDVHVSGSAEVSLFATGRTEFSMVEIPKRASEQMFSETVGDGVNPTGLIANTAASRLPGGIHLVDYLIDNPGGIPAGKQTAINERLDDDTALYVERGYHSDAIWVFLIVGATFGLLVLVATLTATALSQAESRSDSATLASIGASGLTRRRIAAANAVVVGLVGVVFGVVVGAVPGIAVAHPLTEHNRGDGAFHATIDMPWSPIAVVMIGVPLLAGLLAALVTRGRPPMTRRLT